MDRFKNILLVHDEAVGFEAALARAVALAERDGTRLTIAEIVPAPSGDPTARFNPVFPAADDDEGRNRRLDGVLAEARRHGIEVRPAVLRGVPHVEVVRAVMLQGHDLVITAEETRTTLEGLLFGKPASRIMRSCPCPVWVVKPQARARFQRIVAAIAARADDPVAHDIDRSVLDLAVGLAQREGCGLDIVHAWDFEGRDLETSRSEMLPQMRRTLYRRTRIAHARALRATIATANLDGIAHRVHMPKGDPYRILLEFSWEVDVDLIVVGTVSRTGLDRLIHSNLVERILPLADCAVLAVKPAGFQPSVEKAAACQPGYPAPPVSARV